MALSPEASGTLVLARSVLDEAVAEINEAVAEIGREHGAMRDALLLQEATLVPADILEMQLLDENVPFGASSLKEYRSKESLIEARASIEINHEQADAGGFHIEIQTPRDKSPEARKRPKVERMVSVSSSFPSARGRSRTDSGCFSERGSSGGKKGSRSPADTCEIDFQQRLKILLGMEEGTTTLARKIYSRFNGQTDRLPEVLELLEERWGFPNRLFPLLWTNLRRSVFHHQGKYVSVVIGEEEAPANVNEKEWVEAFVRWLQAVQARCGQAKLSRKDLVRRRYHETYSDVNDVYFQGPMLGEGCYGKVHVMFHKALGVNRAVKIIQKEQLTKTMNVASAEEEVKVLRLLDHPHIVRIYETIEVEDTLHIVMDYAEGGDLSAAIFRAQKLNRRLSEIWCREVTNQICSALEYMHSKGIIHCDLKPANSMLLKPVDPFETGSPLPHVVLVDFGISEMFRERRVGGHLKVRGTPLYLSPEAFDGDLTEKSDMWALGVIVCELLTNRRPFESESAARLLVQVATREPPLENLPDLSKEVAKGLLAKDPLTRFTATECRAQEWFHASLEEVSNSSGSPSKGSLSSKSFENIGHTNYFQRAAMFCVAAGLSMKDMSSLFDIFQTIDTDKSGYLTFEQFSEGLQQLGIEQDPEVLMTMLDVDQNGSISYTEFLAGTLLGKSRKALTDQMLKEAFGLFDLDGDGRISVHEVRVMLSGDGPLVEVLPDGNTVEQIMREVGNEEGVISYEDFARYMRLAVEKTKIEQPVESSGSPRSENKLAVEKRDRTASKSSCSPDRGRVRAVSEISPARSRVGSEHAHANPQQAQNVLSKMMHDLDSIDSSKTWITPKAAHHLNLNLSSLMEETSRECSRELGDAMPPFHTWLAEVCSRQPEQVTAIHDVLKFPEQHLDPSFLSDHLASVCQHFWAAMFVARLLAEDPPREPEALRKAVAHAVEAHDQRTVDKARIAELIPSDPTSDRSPSIRKHSRHVNDDVAMANQKIRRASDHITITNQRIQQTVHSEGVASDVHAKRKKPAEQSTQSPELPPKGRRASFEAPAAPLQHVRKPHVPAPERKRRLEKNNAGNASEPCILPPIHRQGLGPERSRSEASIAKQPLDDQGVKSAHAQVVPLPKVSAGGDVWDRVTPNTMKGNMMQLLGRDLGRVNKRGQDIPKANVRSEGRWRP
mmetsp:Transcript_123458/g.193670  ORF Transcript_123458/g.193670 Transcript_123458/m.193670 type:complete len:1178 (-) Transcript_123458:126-3659(-)